jgi:hypothetical protein
LDNFFWFRAVFGGVLINKSMPYWERGLVSGAPGSREQRHPLQTVENHFLNAEAWRRGERKMAFIYWGSKMGP